MSFELTILERKLNSGLFGELGEELAWPIAAHLAKLKKVRAIATGEAQVADDDTGALEAIVQLLDTPDVPRPEPPPAAIPDEPLIAELRKARVLFGLVAQGHIPTIERMLDEYASWEEIAQAIGWEANAARNAYLRHLRRLKSRSQAADVLAGRLREQLARMSPDGRRQVFTEMAEGYCRECGEALQAGRCFCLNDD